MLRRNGNGLRHAKYAKSRSIAVFWELIGDTIYVTFDDHKRAEYHRAITHLRHIRLGKPAPPKQARNTSRFMRTFQGTSRSMVSSSLQRLQRYEGVLRASTPEGPRLKERRRLSCVPRGPGEAVAGRKSSSSGTHGLKRSIRPHRAHPSR